MGRTTTAIFLWALVWANCIPDVAGVNEDLKLQRIHGDVIVRCPESESGRCRDQCSNPAVGVCWPSTALELRDNNITSTCYDTVNNQDRVFTSDIITCTMNQDMRYECLVNLADKERTVFLGIKVSSSGGIGGYTMLNGNQRRAQSSTSLYNMATLHMPGYSPLDYSSASFPFEVDVLCRNWLTHCNVRIVRLLVVKYKCL